MTKLNIYIQKWYAQEEIFLIVSTNPLLKSESTNYPAAVANHHTFLLDSRHIALLPIGIL